MAITAKNNPAIATKMHTLVDAHTHTVDRMSGSLFQGFNIMGESADELSRSADLYRTTDRTTEADDPLALFDTMGDYLSPTWWMNQVLNDTIG